MSEFREPVLFAPHVPTSVRDQLRELTWRDLDHPPADWDLRHLSNPPRLQTLAVITVGTVLTLFGGGAAVALYTVLHVSVLWLLSIAVVPWFAAMAAEHLDSTLIRRRLARQHAEFQRVAAAHRDDVLWLAELDPERRHRLQAITDTAAALDHGLSPDELADLRASVWRAAQHARHATALAARILDEHAALAEADHDDPQVQARLDLVDHAHNVLDLLDDTVRQCQEALAQRHEQEQHRQEMEVAEQRRRTATITATLLPTPLDDALCSAEQLLDVARDAVPGVP